MQYNTCILHSGTAPDIIYCTQRCHTWFLLHARGHTWCVLHTGGHTWLWLHACVASEVYCTQGGHTWCILFAGRGHSWCELHTERSYLMCFRHNFALSCIVKHCSILLYIVLYKSINIYICVAYRGADLMHTGGSHQQGFIQDQICASHIFLVD